MVLRNYRQFFSLQKQLPKSISFIVNKST